MTADQRGSRAKRNKIKGKTSSNQNRRSDVHGTSDNEQPSEHQLLLSTDP
jgi:hypothetical protein